MFNVVGRKAKCSSNEMLLENDVCCQGIVSINVRKSHRDSPSQIEYAIDDVYYLDKLLTRIEERLDMKGLLEICHRCYEHIPTRVELDIRRMRKFSPTKMYPRRSEY